MEWGDGVAGHCESEWRGKVENGEKPGRGVWVVKIKNKNK